MKDAEEPGVSLLIRTPAGTQRARDEKAARAFQTQATFSLAPVLHGAHISKRKRRSSCSGAMGRVCTRAHLSTPGKAGETHLLPEGLTQWLLHLSLPPLLPYSPSWIPPFPFMPSLSCSQPSPPWEESPPPSSRDNSTSRLHSAH
jgi:hypothetical protein